MDILSLEVAQTHPDLARLRVQFGMGFGGEYRKYEIVTYGKTYYDDRGELPMPHVTDSGLRHYIKEVLPVIGGYFKNFTKPPSEISLNILRRNINSMDSIYPYYFDMLRESDNGGN